jgi:chemotaxis protein MotB
MAYARGRRGGHADNFWPGYVDILSTLLLTTIFLMTLFMVAQFFVSQEASGKDTALKKLTRQISELTDMLSLEKGNKKTLDEQLAAMQASLSASGAENKRLQGVMLLDEGKANDANGHAALLQGDLDKQAALSQEAQAKVDLLNQQLMALRTQLAALQAAVGSADTKAKADQATISDLGSKLNLALAKKVQELSQYRSDFFGKLRTLLAGRKDVQVVGDRFVFQAEVLFPSGSDQMNPEGLAALETLAGALTELEGTIPKEINWVLRVDGHTDVRPINNSANFKGNWELSSARAIAVVKYLISRGVSPDRLAAAGFGEFQPLDPAKSEEAYAKNRRIELKLTER